MMELNGIISHPSEQRDLNPRLPSPQDGTLPNCAMPRYNDQCHIDSTRVSNGKRQSLRIY